MNPHYLDHEQYQILKFFSDWSRIFNPKYWIDVSSSFISVLTGEKLCQRVKGLVESNLFSRDWLYYLPNIDWILCFLSRDTITTHITNTDVVIYMYTFIPAQVESWGHALIRCVCGQSWRHEFGIIRVCKKKKIHNPKPLRVSRDLWKDGWISVCSLHQSAPAHVREAPCSKNFGS